MSGVWGQGGGEGGSSRPRQQGQQGTQAVVETEGASESAWRRVEQGWFGACCRTSGGNCTCWDVGPQAWWFGSMRPAVEGTRTCVMQRRIGLAHSAAVQDSWRSSGGPDWRIGVLGNVRVVEGAGTRFGVGQWPVAVSVEVARVKLVQASGKATCLILLRCMRCPDGCFRTPQARKVAVVRAEGSCGGWWPLARCAGAPTSGGFVGPAARRKAVPGCGAIRASLL